MPVDAGDAFQLLSESLTGDARHLWIVLSDPRQDADQVLLVCLCTIHSDRRHDGGCELSAGDHVFVKHPTYVEYALAQVVTVDAIEKLKADGLVQPYPAVTPDLLRRIRNGMGDSHHCRLAHYQLLENQGLLDFSD